MDTRPEPNPHTIAERISQLSTLLRERGFRLTPQRLAVVRLLAASLEHPTAEQIHQAVTRDFPTTSLATIYNTVNVLKEIGEVQELNCGDDSGHFDASPPGKHAHLVCTVCRSVVDVDLAELSGLPGLVAQVTCYQNVQQQLQFRGLCPRCQAAKKLQTNSEPAAQIGADPETN